MARAPKAEVHVSTLSLLTGHMRVASLNLVGAELEVRIERDGQVTVFAGADKRPFVTASVPAVAAASVIGGQNSEGLAQGALSPITPAAAAPRTPQPAPPVAALSAGAPKQTSENWRLSCHGSTASVKRGLMATTCVSSASRRERSQSTTSAPARTGLWRISAQR